jgi:hypothetical protein
MSYLSSRLILLLIFSFEISCLTINSRNKLHTRINKFTNPYILSTKLQLSKNNEDYNRNRQKGEIVGYDNVGDPIYKYDNPNAGGIEILGIKTPLDPLSASLIVFLLIAFNFFVVANL